MHKAQNTGGRGCDLAINLVEQFGVVAERGRRTGRFGFQCHADFGAIVTHAQHGQFQRVLLNAVGDAQQHFLALGGCGAGPCGAAEGGAGAGHSGIDIGGTGIGNARQHRPVER